MYHLAYSEAVRSYDTVWSDWMPVPPPQTNVNIGMKCNVVEDYVLKQTGNTATSVTVRLTNNTDAANTVQYILAAYRSNGSMLTSATSSASLESKGSFDLTLTFAETDDVAEIKAFVLQSGTMTPLRKSWTKRVAN